MPDLFFLLLQHLLLSSTIHHCLQAEGGPPQLRQLCLQSLLLLLQLGLALLPLLAL